MSTAQDVLEELAQTHELPREVIDWRALQKLKGTYIDALPSSCTRTRDACTPRSARSPRRRGV